MQPGAGALRSGRRSPAPGRPTSSRSSRRWRRRRRRRRARARRAACGTRRRSAPCAAPCRASARPSRRTSARARSRRRRSGPSSCRAAISAAKRRGRGGVLDVPVPAGRQPEQLRDPVADEQLELGRAPAPCARGSRPGSASPRAARRGSPARTPRDREVGEEARALPVRDPGQEDLVEVAQHRVERLRLLGRRLPAAARGSRPARPARAPAARRPARGSRPPSRPRAWPSSRKRHFFSSFATCGQVRVLTICSFVSHARRAWPMPSST